MKNFSIIKIDKAFTLAEVLITLGIIGIVAALTIPTLIQNQQEKTTVTRVKKVYSTLANAYNLAVKDNGPTTDWDLGTGNASDGALKVENYFKPYLNIMKDCKTDGNCFSNIHYSGFANNSYSWNYSLANIQFATVQLADGTLLAFWSGGSNNGYGYIIADINGNQKPNQNGVDTFWFTFNDKSLYPYNGWHAALHGADYCDKNVTIQDNGRDCTAWVLVNQNMDYLHCNDLDWNTKTKCD